MFREATLSWLGGLEGGQWVRLKAYRHGANPWVTVESVPCSHRGLAVSVVRWLKKRPHAPHPWIPTTMSLMG